MQTISLDLPWPPTQNHIWRKGRGRVYRNPKYLDWIAEAGWKIKAANPKPIQGRFGAFVTLYPPNKREIDVDNRTKVLLDLAQRMGLIENDSKCRLLLAFYGADSAIIGHANLTLFPM